jgi:periplasmic protein TonB
MHDMFSDVVTHRAKLRNSIVAPFASIPILIVALVGCWSLFTFVLPMPVVEAISFVQIGMKPPTLPSLPPRRVESHPTNPINSGPSAPPIAAPEGVRPEVRLLDAVATLPIGEIPGTELALSLDTKVFTPDPPPAPPVAKDPPAPMTVGGAVKAPTRIKSVNPVYPAIAQAARVQGVVIVEATISASGRVIDAKILRSIPLLDAAALDAVRQWEFTTPTLNGQPIPVIMTVTVNFTLQ